MASIVLGLSILLAHFHIDQEALHNGSLCNIKDRQEHRDKYERDQEGNNGWSEWRVDLIYQV